MKKAIESINTFYASRAMGAIQQLKSISDNPNLAIYSGIKNPGTPILFAAVSIKSECTIAEFYDIFTEDAFKILRDYASCFGAPFVVLYNRDTDSWFKVSFNFIRNLRVKNRKSEKKLFSLNFKQLRITQEGPDYLEKVKFPFKAVKKKEYILPGIENPFS
ncbi:MAG: hypothetical protein JG764_1693 [Clostridiales bacterium]|jgi:hypothetical protein|nr:hypothetical protein [Clostridiales bacterium]